MSRLVVVVVLAVVLAVLAPGLAMGRERWRSPLPDGTLRAAFTFDRAAPYARGARRGVDLGGAAGARVVAVCAGVVTHAGRVPGWGRGVSLRCGGLVATELGLASASVARGARVWPGAVVGRLAQRGVLRLGARRLGVRHGYLDPLGLLSGGARSAPPLAPRGGPSLRPRSRPKSPPRRVAPRRAATALRSAANALPAVAALGTGKSSLPATNARPAVAALPAASAHPAAGAAGYAAALPWPAWAGLGLLAAAVGGGGATQRRQRQHGCTRMALAQR